MAFHEERAPDSVGRPSRQPHEGLVAVPCAAQARLAGPGEDPYPRGGLPSMRRLSRWLARVPPSRDRSGASSHEQWHAHGRGPEALFAQACRLVVLELSIRVDHLRQQSNAARVRRVSSLHRSRRQQEDLAESAIPETRGGVAPTKEWRTAPRRALARHPHSHLVALRERFQPRMANERREANERRSGLPVLQTPCGDPRDLPRFHASEHRARVAPETQRLSVADRRPFRESSKDLVALFAQSMSPVPATDQLPDRDGHRLPEVCWPDCNERDLPRCEVSRARVELASDQEW